MRAHKKLFPVLHDLSPMPDIPRDEEFAFLSRSSVDEYRIEVRKTLGKCSVCGFGCRSNGNLDHVIPDSRGGVTTRTNLALTCRYCNCRKGSLTLEEWGREMLAALRRFHRRQRSREMATV